MMLYILAAYVLIGYLIACVAAAVAPPTEGDKHIRLIALATTIGWGLVAAWLVLTIAWRVVSIPVVVIRKARIRMAEARIVNEQ